MCDIVETGAVQAAVGPLWNFSNGDVMHLVCLDYNARYEFGM